MNDSEVKEKLIFPPIALPAISRTIPPKNCEIPVAERGFTVLNSFLLTILEHTVQNDAPMISQSPIFILKLPDVLLIATIPKKPKIAPNNF